jgi:hypothetical protein
MSRHRTPHRHRAVRNGANSLPPHCPVVIEPVSANVSTKTGISAVWTGDFRQILAKVAIFGRLETWNKRAESQQNATVSTGARPLPLVERVVGWRRRYRTSIWRFRTRCSRLFERSYRTPISFAFISLSKHSNLENRTESAESRAPERNGPFREE